MALMDFSGFLITMTIQWLGGSDSELGVFTFPIYSLFNGEPGSYLEFPNHQIDDGPDFDEDFELV